MNINVEFLNSFRFTRMLLNSNQYFPRIEVHTHCFCFHGMAQSELAALQLTKKIGLPSSWRTNNTYDTKRPFYRPQNFQAFFAWIQLRPFGTLSWHQPVFWLIPLVIVRYTKRNRTLFTIHCDGGKLKPITSTIIHLVQNIRGILVDGKSRGISILSRPNREQFRKREKFSNPRPSGRWATK